MGIRQQDSDDPKGGGIRNDQTTDRFVTSTFIAPLPPKGFRIEKAQNGIRVFAADRGKLVPSDGRISGSVAYRVRWAEQCDISSLDSIKAALVRSTVVSPTIETSGKDNVEAVAFISDPKYSSGFFFCLGVDAAGTESTEWAGPVQLVNAILDNGVPGDPTHVQISASGEYIGADVVEAVTVSLLVPNPIGSFDGMQLFLKDYVNLGSVQEGEFHRYTGAPGGSMQFKDFYGIAKRIGIGTLNVTNGSTAVVVSQGALRQAQAGDYLEAIGARGFISSVNTDTSMTLAAPWTGKTVVGLGEYAIIGNVTVYVVAISKGGTHQADITLAPHSTLLFDGSIGVPIAPTITATTLDNTIRIEFQQVLGTKIKGYTLYRGLGAGTPYLNCSVLDNIPQPKATSDATLSLIQYEDSSFTQTQKETGVIFAYYVTTMNELGIQSSPSVGVNASCRLASSQDVDPATTARVGVKNLLYNAWPGGTTGNTILASDLSQDGFNGTSVGNLPGVPYNAVAARAIGTGKFKGYTRWESAGTGGAPVRATFINNAEAKFPFPGVGQFCYLQQELDSWDLIGNPAQSVKIKKDGIYVFSCYIRYDSVAGKPDGTFQVYIEQYNTAVVTGYASRRYRDSGTNTLLWYDDSGLGTVNANCVLNFACSGLTLGWQRIYGVFRMNSALTGLCAQVRVNFALAGSTLGALYLTQAMFSEGEEIGYWVGDMGDPTVSQPAPVKPPGGIGDGDGLRRGFFPEYRLP